MQIETGHLTETHKHFIRAACDAGIIDGLALTSTGDELKYAVLIADEYRDLFGAVQTGPTLEYVIGVITGYLGMNGHDIASIIGGETVPRSGAPAIERLASRKDTENHREDVSETSGDGLPSDAEATVREVEKDDPETDPIKEETGEEKPTDLDVVGKVEIDEFLDREAKRFSNPRPNRNPDTDPKTAPSGKAQILRVAIDRPVWTRMNPSKAALWLALAHYGRHRKIILVSVFKKLAEVEELTGLNGKELIGMIEREGAARVEQDYHMTEHENGIAVLICDESHEWVAEARELMNQAAASPYKTQTNTWSRQ